MKNLHKVVLISGITLGIFCGAAAAQAEVTQVPAAVANVQVEAPTVPAAVAQVQTVAPKVQRAVVKAKIRHHAKKADKVLVVSEQNDHHFKHADHRHYGHHGHGHCHDRRHHHVAHFYRVPVRHVVFHPVHFHHRHDVVRLPVWISINL